MARDTEIVRILSAVTTATITTILLKKGLRNVWLRGTRPLKPGQPRIVGPAFTLRFVPAREDLATPESWSSPTSTRAAIEAMPPGCIAVVDAMGVTDAGIFGDILCARMAKRGVAALVTDGVVRDVAGDFASDAHLLLPRRPSPLAPSPDAAQACPVASPGTSASACACLSFLVVVHALAALFPPYFLSWSSIPCFPYLLPPVF